MSRRVGTVAANSERTLSEIEGTIRHGKVHGLGFHGNFEGIESRSITSNTKISSTSQLELRRLDVQLTTTGVNITGLASGRISERKVSLQAHIGCDIVGHISKETLKNTWLNGQAVRTLNSYLDCWVGDQDGSVNEQAISDFGKISLATDLASPWLNINVLSILDHSLLVEDHTGSCESLAVCIVSEGSARFDIPLVWVVSSDGSIQKRIAAVRDSATVCKRKDLKNAC